MSGGGREGGREGGRHRGQEGEMEDIHVPVKWIPLNKAP